MNAHPHEQASLIPFYAGIVVVLSTVISTAALPDQGIKPLLLICAFHAFLCLAYGVFVALSRTVFAVLVSGEFAAFLSYGLCASFL